MVGDELRPIRMISTTTTTMKASATSGSHRSQGRERLTGRTAAKLSGALALRRARDRSGPKSREWGALGGSRSLVPLRGTRGLKEFRAAESAVWAALHAGRLVSVVGPMRPGRRGLSAGPTAGSLRLGLAARRPSLRLDGREQHAKQNEHREAHSFIAAGDNDLLHEAHRRPRSPVRAVPQPSERARARAT